MQHILHNIRAAYALTALCLSLWAARTPPVVCGAEEDSVKVYKRLSPSIVSLSSAEGSGTGVLVSSKGTIITNAHVVSSPLPYKVQIDIVGSNDSMESLEYKNVKVIGYHPTLDLALIKIDTSEHPGKTLKPAALAKERGTPGQQIFVIGNPAAGGHVLTKSITTGMLSAVDRTIEGEAYYQIDAAINPGNSGGPICDRVGRVLGLVTFKFVDADAVGFAIPLHDISPKSFVPLSQRRSNPEKAQELLRLADRYGELSREAARTEGPEGPTSKVFDVNAVICYREAFLYDPANPAVYYNIGTILRTLDADNVAVGYLIYALQLAPWSDPQADPYRELGLAFVKQNQESAALAAWREGLTKFPYSAKIWEDLAIYHIQHAQPKDAAICASTALLLAEKETRRDVMQQVIGDAKGQAGTSSNKLTEEIADKSIVVTLDRMLSASNKARAAKKLYITREFESVIKEFGGPPIDGAGATIPSEPLARLPELARISGSGEAISEMKSSTKASSEEFDDDWIGKNNDGRQVIDNEITPTPSDKNLVKKTRTVVDAVVTDLDVGKVTDVAWSCDEEAKYLFALEHNGVLRKIETASWTEVLQIDLKTACSSLAINKAGLFISEPEIQEVVQLDGDTLTPMARYPAAGAGIVSSAPTLSHAYASIDNGRSLVILDGEKKSIFAQFPSTEIATTRGNSMALGISFERFVITPNGKFLLCESNSQLHRIAVNEARLTHEESGANLGSNPQQVVVSSDSKYAALPCGGGNRDDEHQGYFTFIYRVNDLSKPICVVDGGAYPKTLGFDSKAKLIYAQNHEHQLITYTPSGVKQKEYAIFGHGESPDRLLVHPDGRKVLIKTNDSVAFVKLPD